MLSIPKSKFDQFKHKNASKRWGQAFYDFMKFNKVTNPIDKPFLDKLYNATDDVAKAMVQSRIDHNN